MDTSKAFGGNIYFSRGKTNKTWLCTRQYSRWEMVTPGKAGSLGPHVLEQKINEQVTSGKHHPIKSWQTPRKERKPEDGAGGTTASTKMVREGHSEVSLDLGNERSKGWGLGVGFPKLYVRELWEIPKSNWGKQKQSLSIEILEVS